MLSFCFRSVLPFFLYSFCSSKASVWISFNRGYLRKPHLSKIAFTWLDESIFCSSCLFILCSRWSMGTRVLDWLNSTQLFILNMRILIWCDVPLFTLSQECAETRLSLFLRNIFYFDYECEAWASQHMLKGTLGKKNARYLIINANYLLPCHFSHALFINMYVSLSLKFFF